jgi:hypothetical protein
MLPPSLFASETRSPLERLAALPLAERTAVIASLSRREQADLLRLLEATETESGPIPFRQFLESPNFCGLTLSPMIAAIADASEGLRPTTIDDATCERYFGCSLDELPRERRRLVAVQAGGRGGKTSRLLAPKALHAAWTVPLPTLGPGEHAVSLLISSELVFAKQAFSFVVGYVQQSPVLSAALAGEPTADSLTLRRPDGKLVDVRVRAAGAKGKGGRAFTLVFAGLDEACFFYDDSGVVNDREIHRAVAQRIVPGGQEWLVSTPWIEGVGVLEEQLSANWGSHERSLAVRGVGTKALNPGWDPTGEIEADLRESDPDNAEREIDAKALAAGSTHFFSREAIEAAFSDDLAQQSPRRTGREYHAGGDAGFKRNSSALAVVETTTDEHGKRRHLLARLEERKPRPGLPLQPKVVAAEFAGIALEYGARELVADSHEIDDVRAACAGKGVSVTLAPDKQEMFADARSALHEGRVRLPRNPRLKQQLREILQRPLPGGGVQVYAPKKSDGSHGDLVSALVNALWRAEKKAASQSSLEKYRDRLPKPRM